MLQGPELTLLNWVLSALPILVLVGGILLFRWSAPRAGAVALLAVLLLGGLRFGADARLLVMASAKGFSLTLFVLSIIWSAVFLYNLIERLGAVKAIGHGLVRLGGDQLGVGLLIAWAFSGFMQGIAGFGVPVAVVAPLLVLAGFPAATAVTAALVGHAWAVTFGSMGSSYYTIQLVTGIPGEVIGPRMALLFALPILSSGLAVAHIVQGRGGLKRGAPLVLLGGGAMAFFVWAMARIGAAQIASVVPGLVGCGVLWVILRRRGVARVVAMPPTTEARVATDQTSDNPSHRLGFHLAFLPYYLLIALTGLSQLLWLKAAARHLSWGLDYPALTTALGYQVKAASNYASISLVRHPAPLILAAALLTFAVFWALGRWQRGAAWAAAKATYRQSLATSVGVATMVAMALVMIDTGMTQVLAQGIARVTGVTFPFFSPYIGVLGTFLTGSNTNSNVMFGALQTKTAQALGLSTVTLASAQSIGGSLASSIAPAKVLVGTALVGLQGREGEVMRRAIPYCLALVALVGVEVWVVAYLVK